jgi:hypothetical protein
MLVEEDVHESLSHAGGTLYSVLHGALRRGDRVPPAEAVTGGEHEARGDNDACTVAQARPRLQALRSDTDHERVVVVYVGLSFGLVVEDHGKERVLTKK